MKLITQKEKNDLLLLSNIRGCWLNGIPAVIRGKLNKFATIYQYDTGLSVEFSWQATRRIMHKNRCFVS